MVDQEPLYKLINQVNWPNPDPISYTILTDELSRLMTMVENIIDDDARMAARDALQMEAELLRHGLIPNEVDDQNNSVPVEIDDNATYTEEEAAALDIDPSHPGILYDQENNQNISVPVEVQMVNNQHQLHFMVAVNEPNDEQKTTSANDDLQNIDNQPSTSKVCH